MGAGIDPAWLFSHFHLVYWIWRDLDPQPLDHESSLLTTRPEQCPIKPYYKSIDDSYLVISQFWESIVDSREDGLQEGKLRVESQEEQHDEKEYGP